MDVDDNKAKPFIDPDGKGIGQIWNVEDQGQEVSKYYKHIQRVSIERGFPQAL